MDKNKLNHHGWLGSRANWSDELGSSACVDHVLSAGEGMGPLFDV